MDVRMDHRQAQTLSPRLQHAVRLLQMSSLDFGAMVRETLGKNPFLEHEDGDGDADGGGDAGDVDTDGDGITADHDRHADAMAAADHADPAALIELSRDGDSGESEHQADTDNSNDSDSVDHMDGVDPAENDRDMWQADGTGSGQRKGEDGEMSALDMMCVETSLNDHLHGQLNVMALSPRDLALARAVVESLDDDGYLRTPLEELAQLDALSGLTPEVSVDDMQIAMRRVQSLEPAGVGARNVGECLLLQLHKIECTETRALAQVIVGEHLQALAAKDINGLAHRLRLPAARIEAVCQRIRRLDPRPGWRVGASQTAYVVPDVVVKKVRGQWAVQLNPAVVPRVKLNQTYAELFQRHRTPQNTELAGHLQEARWTLRNVEQRFNTILDVAEAIVRRQRHFLEFGAMAMKPLGLKEIADEVGIHESTVSRVTNNKYMATPGGVFELKYFFSRAMVSDNGSACSGTAIRGLIKDIIDVEAAEAPLSDAEITRQLGQQGLRVARRTVTKYRQMLKIEAVERRRRHAVPMAA